MRKLIGLLIVAALLSLSGPGVAGPYEEGYDAHNRQDYATALRLWRPLANQGHVLAQVMLGAMYFWGQGVPQDYAEAASWSRKAADQGHVDAQGVLGVLYYAGQGVPQDYAEAASWSRKAADQGHALAQRNLGAHYYDGQGVPQDYLQAHKWFNLAAAGGNKDAAKSRDIVAAKMTPAQIAEAQKLAREWRPTTK